MRSRPPPGRPRGRGEDVVRTRRVVGGGAAPASGVCLRTGLATQNTTEVPMLRKLRPHLSYANVAATLALVLAAGGSTAYAAAKIGKSDIGYHAVTSSKV